MRFRPVHDFRNGQQLARADLDGRECELGAHLSHSTDEFAPERTHQASAEAKERGATWIPRSKDDIRRMFNGKDLIDPGLVLVSRWRPDGGVPGPNADRAWSYGGVASI